jgi:amino acid permease
MLWRIYGDNFSVDMLRRIYISEMVSYLEDLDNPVETIKWRKRLAFMVGHSLESQEFIYSNFKRMKRKKSSKKYMDEIFEYLKAAYVGE